MMKNLSKEWGNKEPHYKLHPIDSTIIFESQIQESSYIETDRLKDLNERQKKAVEYIKNKGSITNRKYREINSISSKRIAAEELTYLTEKKITKKQGKGRSVYYILVND